MASFVWWVLLYPILWLLAAPVILIAALFSKYPYWEAVRDMYRRLTKWWTEWGDVIVP